MKTFEGGYNPHEDAEAWDDPSPLESFYDQANAYLSNGALEHSRLTGEELENHLEILAQYVEKYGEGLGDFQLVLPDAVVPLQKQLEAVGGYGFIETSELKDTVLTPQVPYLLTDIDLGFEDRGKASVPEARMNFAEYSATGLTIGEVLAIAATDRELWGRDADITGDVFMGMVASESFHPGWEDKPDAYIDLYRIGDRLKIKRDMQDDDLRDTKWVIPSAADRIPSIDPEDS